MVSQKTSPQWLRILLLFIGHLTIAINALQALSFPKHLCIGRSPAQKIVRSLDEQRGFSHWSRSGPTLHKFNSEKMFLSCLTQQILFAITPSSNGENCHCFTDSNPAQQLLAEYVTWFDLCVYCDANETSRPSLLSNAWARSMLHFLTISLFHPV